MTSKPDNTQSKLIMSAVDEYHGRMMADFSVEAFFGLVTERLIDAGELEVAVPAHYESGKGAERIRIDGYSGDPRDNNGVLELIVCDFADSDTVQTFGEGEVPLILNPLVRFLKKAKTEEFRNSLDGDDPAFDVSNLIVTTWSLIKKIRLILISNRQYIGKGDVVTLESISEVPISWSVWDLARLQRFDRSRQARDGEDRARHDTRPAAGAASLGMLRHLELFEAIGTEIERKRRAAQWMAEIPAEWTRSVEQRVAREIAGWPDETSGEVKADVSSAAERIASGFATFRVSFDGAYQSLMETMFPSVAVPALLRAVRSSTVDPGAAGAVASQDPAEEKIRARLPAWVVVPYADAPEDMPEFAILWAGEGDAPELPPLELRLHGQPRDENVFWPEVRTDVADLPPGKVTFVRFDTLKPRAATIIEREDGGLVIDFT